MLTSYPAGPMRFCRHSERGESMVLLVWMATIGGSYVPVICVFIFSEETSECFFLVKSDQVSEISRLVEWGAVRSTYFLINNAFQIFLWWWAEYTQNVIQLIQVMFAWEYWPIAEHFSQYATHRPNINWFCVTLHLNEDKMVDFDERIKQLIFLTA